MKDQAKDGYFKRRNEKRDGEDRNKYKIKIMKEQNNGERVGLEGKLNVGKEK